MRIFNHKSRFDPNLSLALALVLFYAGNHFAHAADDEPEDIINYAYSTWVGSGFYKVDDRRVYVLRGPFSWTIRKPDSQNWGLDLLFPATIGFHDYPDENEQVGTITFVPGVEFIYPVLENWWLKPFGQFGVGRDFSGSDTAYIWAGGIKSLATFPMKGFELDLGNSLTYADQSQSGGGNDDGFSMFEIGLNSRWPLNLSVLQSQTNLNVFFVYTQFINALGFDQVDEDHVKIRRLYKFGLALGAKTSFSIFGFEFGGIGIDFTLGDAYRGVGLNLGFPF